jgi:phosphomevalonate kinase
MNIFNSGIKFLPCLAPELFELEVWGFEVLTFTRQPWRSTLIGLVVYRYIFVSLADLLIWWTHNKQVLQASLSIKSMSVLNWQVSLSTELAKTSHAATCMSIGNTIQQSQIFVEALFSSIMRQSCIQSYFVQDTKMRRREHTTEEFWKLNMVLYTLSFWV